MSLSALPTAPKRAGFGVFRWSPAMAEVLLGENCEREEWEEEGK